MASNRNAICIGLGDTGGNGTHAALCDQLDRYHGIRIDLLEIENQLGKILD